MTTSYQDVEWQNYLTSKDDAFISILVATNLPEAWKQYDTLIHVKINALAVNPEHGLPEQEDFTDISNIENLCAQQMDPNESIYVGRTVTNGQYTLYIYSNNPDNAKQSIIQIISPFSNRSIEIDAMEDTNWEQYNNELYPTPEHWQQIKDYQILESLHEFGDDLSQPRDIDHYFFFESKEQCNQVAEHLSKNGFTFVSINPPEEDEKNWSLAVQREDSVAPQEITTLTVSLMKFAEEHEGTYDGWGCMPVETNE